MKSVDLVLRDIVLYNERHNERQKGGKLAGLSELDVVGLNLVKRAAFLCEVTTHILGMLIKDVPTTVTKVNNKYKAQQAYAAALRAFSRFGVRVYTSGASGCYLHLFRRIENWHPVN